MEKQKSLLAITLLFCFVNLAAATGAQYQVGEDLSDEVHLLPDVSFESAEAGGLPSGWSSIQPDSVAVFDSPDDALHGTKSIRLEPSTSSWTTRRVSQLTVGKRYLFSANVKITGDDGVGLIIARDEATRAILGIERVRPGAYQSWQKLVTEFVAPHFSTSSNCRRLIRRLVQVVLKTGQINGSWYKTLRSDLQNPC